MPKRISKIKNSLKQIGDMQVMEWDFMALLNKDIKELEIADSLRKLGNKKVLDWDFKSTLPSVHEFVHQEVDVAGWVKRAADYKVIDWDSKSPESIDQKAPTPKPIPTPEEIQSLTRQLHDFLQYLASSLLHQPDRAEIRIIEPTPGMLWCKLLVAQADVKPLIGRDGATATAIRNLIKSTAASLGADASLQIISHEEDLAESRRPNQRARK
jgi:predicted RNA-binding protein YlqC (UPF0109 family)